MSLQPVDFGAFSKKVNHTLIKSKLLIPEGVVIRLGVEKADMNAFAVP
jgi:hypothetical protein